MGFFFCFVDQLWRQVEAQNQASSFTVAIDRHADRPVLNVEGDRYLPVHHYSPRVLILHDVPPV